MIFDHRNKNNNDNEKRRVSAKWRILAIGAAIMIMLSACGTAATQTADTASGTETSTTVYTAASKSEMFTDRDLSGDYDESSAVKVTLNGNSASVSGSEDGVSIDGSTITITKEGTYILTGSLTDGMVVVEAGDSDKVQIVLDNASVTSSSSAALYVKQADKVFVTTADGTQNTLANGGTFTAIDDNNIDGAVFAKDDVTFNGKGSLTVTSPAGHGAVGKDDVKFAGGTVTIEAAKHGVDANDSARFAEATVNITAGTDGVHVSDDSDAENGEASDSYFYIADGTLKISAGDDGIHADAEAITEGGAIDITESYESIEALSIKISGGDINVKAKDDGLNAAGGKASTGSDVFGEDDWAGGKQGFSDGGSDGSIVISGGDMHITAGGDGIDSNGSIEISGGYTLVTGPTQGDTSIMDYNTTATVTGGTFIGTGGSGMGANFSSAENQGVITVSTGGQSAGTAVKLTDADGKTLAEVTPELDYDVVMISTPDMKTGSTYTLSAGSYSETIELNDAVYGSLNGRGGMGRGNGGMPDMNNGNGGKGGMHGGHGGHGGRGPGNNNSDGASDSSGSDGITGATQDSGNDPFSGGSAA